MNDERPRWSQRLQHLRRSRGWSQQQAVDALRRAASEPLAEDDSLLRKWKRWESGVNMPDANSRPAIGRAFGVNTERLFADDNDEPGGLDVITDPAIVELVTRMDRSDLDQPGLDRIAVAVDQMCADYSALPPVNLLSEVSIWFQRIDRLLGMRHSDSQRRQIGEIQGWLALLAGSIEFDMLHRRDAEVIRRYVERLARETGNAHHEAWARELAAWFNLNDGAFGAVVAEARAGQSLAPHSPVAAQLAGHEAEAHARMGNPKAALEALDTLNQHRATLRAQETPRHHFQLESSKFDKVEMRLLSLFGRHSEAVTVAEEIITSVGGVEKGRIVHPMILAKALAAIGVAAAAEGDVDQAVAMGHQALDIPRQTIPSLIASTEDLRAALAIAHRERSVRELTDRIDALAHAA